MPMIDIDNDTFKKATKPIEEPWRKLPSVKYCLDGLLMKEARQSIAKACYAMRKLGYGDDIPQFLCELGWIDGRLEQIIGQQLSDYLKTISRNKEKQP